MQLRLIERKRRLLLSMREKNRENLHELGLIATELDSGTSFINDAIRGNANFATFLERQDPKELMASPNISASIGTPQTIHPGFNSFPSQYRPASRSSMRTPNQSPRLPLTFEQPEYFHVLTSTNR
jgi:hypothetical protein